jgi:hypothetical protein
MNFFERVLNAFKITVTKQKNKGVKEYGKYVDPLDSYNWTKMAKEELADAFVYIEAEEAKKELVRTKVMIEVYHIRSLIKDKDQFEDAEVKKESILKHLEIIEKEVDLLVGK